MMGNKMRDDWDARAKWNARRAIVPRGWRTEKEFDKSGKRSVHELLNGLRQYIHRDIVALDIGCGEGKNG